MKFKKVIAGGAAVAMLAALVPAATALADDAAAPAGPSTCDLPMVGYFACVTITYQDENGKTLNTQKVESYLLTKLFS